MLEIREQLKDIVMIQPVAFPQKGMYAYKGGGEMVEEALKMGADCVGSIPLLTARKPSTARSN